MADDPQQCQYKVKVQKDHLVFSAAHFITFAGNICERIHGHNYRVEVEVDNPLDENHYVFDFIALLDQTRQIVGRLDHHVLLPTKSPLIDVFEEGPQVVARFEDRMWSFPAGDCILLPIPNTTAELLAHWIGEELRVAWRAGRIALPAAMRVRVEENFGQWAECQWS